MFFREIWLIIPVTPFLSGALAKPSAYLNFQIDCDSIILMVKVSHSLVAVRGSQASTLYLGHNI